jgi:hypothetical protein
MLGQLPHHRRKQPHAVLIHVTTGGLRDTAATRYGSVSE